MRNSDIAYAAVANEAQNLKPREVLKGSVGHYVIIVKDKLLGREMDINTND